MVLIVRYIGICSLFFLLLLGTSCSSSLSTTRKGAARLAPSGKYRVHTKYSRVNPFQGSSKQRLYNAKKKKAKKKKLNKRRGVAGSYRKGRKPGGSFSMKRKLGRGRLSGSGSRSKGGSSGGGKNKDLFKVRKK